MPFDIFISPREGNHITYLHATSDPNSNAPNVEPTATLMMYVFRLNSGGSDGGGKENSEAPPQLLYTTYTLEVHTILTILGTRALGEVGRVTVLKVKLELRHLQAIKDDNLTLQLEQDGMASFLAVSRYHLY